MKIIMIDANKDELAANKRVADTIVDALANFLDNFTVPNSYVKTLYDNDNNNNNLEEEVDEDGSN